MEWIDEDVAQLEEGDELVEEYLEEGKAIIEGKENAKSLTTIEEHLKDDLGPGDDLQYKAVSYAVNGLADDSETTFYRNTTTTPITEGKKQFYIEQDT